MKPEHFQSPYRTTGASLSREALDRYTRRAHYLRSLAFKRAVQRLLRGVSAAFRSLKTSRDRRRAIAELNALSERTLKDIGIDRSQIPLIVEQLLARREADGDAQKVYPLRALTRDVDCSGVKDAERCPPLAA